MVNQVNFLTNGTATSGTATEELSGLGFFYSPGMAIVDVFQTSSGTVANDADWTMLVDGITTRYKWLAEELNPANIGRMRLPSAIKIRPGAQVQFKWAGQTAAAANTLKLLYETIG